MSSNLSAKINPSLSSGAVQEGAGAGDPGGVGSDERYIVKVDECREKRGEERKGVTERDNSLNQHEKDGSQRSK